MTRILIVDDVDLAPTLSQRLSSKGYIFEQETDPARAMDVIRLTRPDAVLLDLHFPEDAEHATTTVGGRLLADIRRAFPHLPVVVWTTRLNDFELPIERFEPPAHAQVAKPMPGDRTWPEQLAQTLAKVLDDARSTGEGLSRTLGFLVGETPEMLAIARRLRDSAASERTILVLGESGTGKELAARAIHKVSPRSSKPFVAVNTGSTQRDLVMSALFGHRRGAFTGAVADQKGYFAAAEGGTLFLDEIGDMPDDAQTALLRVLNDGTYSPVGDTREIRADVRVVAATHRDLQALIGAGTFREDLFMRLNAESLTLPPLRERVVDIPEFFKRFVDAANSANRKAVSARLHPETRTKLESYGWPGNVREFENVITGAVIHTRNSLLLPSDFDFPDHVVPTITRHSARPVAAASLGVSFDSGSDVLARAYCDRLQAALIEERYEMLKGMGAGAKSTLVELVRRPVSYTHLTLPTIYSV